MASTIYDIARLANVSKSTVSRVLNKQTNISDEARDRVLKAIEQVNYQPNKLARGLTSSGFDAIMVISTRSTKTTSGNPFFSEILHAIASRSEEEGFDVILQTTKNSQEDLEKCISKIRQKMIKGIIMLSSPADESFFRELDSYDVPVVVIGNVEGQYRNVYSVDTDNFQDSYRLTECLIKQGHRKIACLHASLDYHVSIDRLAGYKACLQAHNLPLNSHWIQDGGYTTESAYTAAMKLISQEDAPTAVFATDGLKVMSIYRAVYDRGQIIPNDISVIGYSNDNISMLLSPPLSGIEVPTRELGWTGSDILFDKISGKEHIAAKTLVPTHLALARSVLAQKE
ncbi:LacI family DNA-binding transcriptional regulator [Limnobaculum parvum]|uniref:LacI family transcriptional regulator n=1 Tax=Limnobaculum parvum TaxID=2172103 RepID=A0A2Y9TZS0_9GAMM|nr:LacI family DNA-binding transcriptional regulator [Limnobaculum parvum]AWH88991.1 LacI family transcriptional regulator [Limnobaculum parvum]